jgi:hypothetical protein
MAVKIKINTNPAEAESSSIKIKINKRVEYIKLKASKTLDGNIIIADHPDMQIIIMPKTNKIVALPKDELDDELYETQNRFFKSLVKRGVVDYNSVQAGNLFMSMEGLMLKPSGEGDMVEHVLFAVFKFMEIDLPFYRDKEEFEKEEEARLTDPEADERTEFDPDRFHDDVKGSLPPKGAAYGINSVYRI